MNRLTRNTTLSCLNACCFNLMDPVMHRAYMSFKSDLFANLPKHIVELGAGCGANFRYYPPGTRVTAIEPNPFMTSCLKRRAARHGVQLLPIIGRAEEIELPDDSVDAVVGSLVLCTVDSPFHVLQEVRRVLRAHGRFLFLEHVRAERAFTAGVQRWVNSPWRWLFQGCHLRRDTASSIEKAGFSRVEMSQFQLPAWIPFSPHIYGWAEK